MNPQYPIYVISKGRWKSRLTAKALYRRNIPFKIVIEPQEFDKYASVMNEADILTLPFSNLGQGSIPARNWVWEHSIDLGAERHWILDDNIRNFFRLNKSAKIRTSSGVTFKACEDFVDRYENVALAGMQYRYFVPSRETHKPFRLNRRIYSCILIKNDIPFRWRGRYNEDTDLSIRVLREGWVTVLFYAFLCEKIETTAKLEGGNTEELYQGDWGKADLSNGRYRMALSLQRQHPDITRIIKKWGRWHHEVDYRQFRGNRLIKKKDLQISNHKDEYNMKLKQTSTLKKSSNYFKKF